MNFLISFQIFTPVCAWRESNKLTYFHMNKSSVTLLTKQNLAATDNNRDNDNLFFAVSVL